MRAAAVWTSERSDITGHPSRLNYSSPTGIKISWFFFVIGEYFFVNTRNIMYCLVLLPDKDTQVINNCTESQKTRMVSMTDVTGSRFSTFLNTADAGQSCMLSLDDILCCKRQQDN